MENKKAKLIVIEGTDASGKQTQSNKLINYLRSIGYKVKYVSFPNYKSDSSIYLKQYLNGKFGDTANSLNAYQASMLFALDRFITYKDSLKDDIEKYDFIILDRYIGSNLIHQGAKLLPRDSFNNDYDIFYDFIKYQYDFEINKLDLPEPDLTIYLNLPYRYGKKIAKNRKNKIDPSIKKKDVHEKDSRYMSMAESAGLKISKLFGWNIIDCLKKGLVFKNIRSIDSISNEIRDLVINKFINNKDI